MCIDLAFRLFKQPCFLRGPDCNFEGNNSVFQPVCQLVGSARGCRTDGWLVGWFLGGRTYLKTKGNGAVYNWKQVARDSYMTSTKVGGTPKADEVR